MGQTMVARAGSLGASALLMGGAVLLALTMTYTVQELNFSEPTEVIQVTPEPPPPPPPPEPTTQQNLQPIAAPSHLSPLPLLPVDANVAPVAYAGPVAPVGPMEITSPRWQERPHNLRRYYPPRALARNIEGEVLLDCRVAVSGVLNCAVISESPEGWGFADAAQRIAGAHQMVPARRDGVAVEGRYAMRVPFQIE